MPLDPLYAARLAEVEALGPDATGDQVSQIMDRPYGPVATGELTITNTEVAGPRGPVPLRIYSPVGTAPGDQRPGLVWCHGGGFMHGDLDMPESDQSARVIADLIGGVVVAVDYRLVWDGNPPQYHLPLPDSPISNQYPAGLDDVMAAWLHTHAHAVELGIDPSQLAIGGTSAGANLISGAVVRLRDEGLPMPYLWLPIYPGVHATAWPQSDQLVADLAEHGSGFDQASLDFFAHAYGASIDDPYGYVGSRDDLAGLPRCLIINDQYDELRGSGEAFAASLAAAGVDVTCTMATGMAHGHLNLLGHPAALATLRDIAAEITR